LAELQNAAASATPLRSVPDAAPIAAGLSITIETAVATGS
jgi:hypothetical protein